MPVSEMTIDRILGDRKWPAWFTVDQCREQMKWEESQTVVVDGVPCKFKAIYE